MSDNPAEPPKDSLGLDLDSLKINDEQNKPAPEQSDKDEAPVAETVPETPTSTEADVQSSQDATATEPTGDATATDDKKLPPREKKKPYVNPERVKTGGSQREKPSEEELATRMARIREQNEKIKQRRIDVEADEKDYKKTQVEESIKQARDKKVQKNVDKAREQNARRKLDKIQNREWDSGKPGVKTTPPTEPSNPANQPPPPNANIGIRGGVRGGGSGRGRGRGRGAGPAPAAAASRSPVASPKEENPAETAAAPA
ncbi:hypothetical protein BDW22DRAFT_1360758 [Trametopsis cervina]|nr:hypothetical protein BDW22DRAFT_1360758 [Trametopsis cervina]